MYQNKFNIVDYILTLAQKPNARENISLLLDNLFDLSQKEKQEENRKEKAASSIAFFTTRELLQMPLQFRKLFKSGKVCAHIKRRIDNLFEIRCQINGKFFVATSKSLDVCKNKFIAKLNDSKDTILQTQPQKVLLANYIQSWLETAKKPFIKDVTYKGYIQTVNAYIYRNLKIVLWKVSNVLNYKICLRKYPKAVNIVLRRRFIKSYPLYSNTPLRTELFSVAPMAKVKLPRYEQKHGVPLTREEEFALLQELKRNPTIYNQAYSFIMYTGLRRSELASVEIDGDWINLITAKQRKGMKEKRRSIPISPMLKQILPFIDIDKIKSASVGVLTNRFKNVCPNHHLHDLRHTFITRAQECGIRREIVSLWAGHKADSSITTNVYTHLEQNKELQVSEIQKYNYSYN